MVTINNRGKDQEIGPDTCMDFEDIMLNEMSEIPVIYHLLYVGCKEANTKTVKWMITRGWGLRELRRYIS